MKKFMKLSKDDIMKAVEITYGERIKDLEYVLEQIINSLPSKKDWLDPDVEKAARNLLKKKY